MEGNTIQLHITYEEELSFKDFTQLVSILDDSFDSAMAIASIEAENFPNDPKIYIKRVREGSIIFDILIPILVGVSVNVISWKILEILKERLNKSKEMNVIDVTQENSGIGVKLPKQVKFPQKKKWTPKEEDVLAKKAVDVYVNKKQKIDVDTFIRDPEFADIIAVHGVNSIRQKLRNIRYILDQVKPNGHTLEISPLRNCSKENIKAVKRYL